MSTTFCLVPVIGIPVSEDASNQLICIKGKTDWFMMAVF
jgi:hypothetical protein